MGSCVSRVPVQTCGMTRVPVQTYGCVMKLYESSRCKFYPGNCRSTPVAIATAARVTETLKLARKEVALGNLQTSGP